MIQIPYPNTVWSGLALQYTGCSIFPHTRIDHRMLMSYKDGSIIFIQDIQNQRDVQFSTTLSDIVDVFCIPERTIVVVLLSLKPNLG